MVKNKSNRILVFGTFDMVHPGHLHFFRQARSLSPNPYLIVSVARSANVMKIKGAPPIHSEKFRVANLKKIKLIDKVILGATEDYLTHICLQKPDIIALGYDQKAYTKDLKKLLLVKGVAPKICRLKAHRPKKYKTSLIKSATINKIKEKNMENTTGSKHYKSFWPIVIIVILSFFAGGSVMWIVFNSNLQENVNSIFPSYNARLHKQIEKENAQATSTLPGTDKLKSTKDAAVTK